MRSRARGWTASEPCPAFPTMMGEFDAYAPNQAKQVLENTISGGVRVRAKSRFM